MKIKMRLELSLVDDAVLTDRLKTAAYTGETLNPKGMILNGIETPLKVTHFQEHTDTLKAVAVLESPG